MSLTTTVASRPASATAVARPIPEPGGALPQSSVVGSGHFIETDGPFELSVNARGEGPLAEGHVRGSGDYAGEFQVEGPVTCMLVVGNRALIKYRFRRSSGPRAPPQDGGVQGLHRGQR